MCNTCYSGVYGGVGGYRATCGYYNQGYENPCQRICRDCCGHIIVYNPTNCGCGNNTSTTTPQNGNYRCLTICGNWTIGGQTTTAAPNGGDAYYAAQYGLGRNGCPCVLGNGN